jgi:hypothetical protein
VEFVYDNLEKDMEDCVNDEKTVKFVKKGKTMATKVGQGPGIYA